MFMSCVLVRREIRCGATTCAGSDASQSGVEVTVGGSVGDGNPPRQATNSAAHSGIAARAPGQHPRRITYLLCPSLE
jgi:hypothetical protein